MSVCEYQENGLTKGAKNLEKNNPMGYAMMYNQKLEYVKGFKIKCFNAMQCNALRCLAGHPEYILQSYARLFSLLMFLPGLILSVRRKLQNKEK